MRPSSPLEDVAGAILDGTAVDWPGVDSGSDQTESPLIDQLKTLAKLRLVSTRADVNQWGHLRVFERIGQGAYGDVYRAWDTRLEREVALKLLPEGPAPSFALRATEGKKAGHYEGIEEGRLLARVRHPNVVTIYGAERIGDRVGLWMELVTGRTLEQALRDGTTFLAKDIERLGVELCRAVAAVHAAGLLHRDIKAQNVMMADDGRFVLMDFGTGREFDRMADGNVSGTPLYLAPEVLTGSGATARSDVYSVGVVLYHLLTGSYPVQARDLASLRRAHSARTAGTLPDESRRIPPRLRRVIARALDPNPDRRYATAELFGAALTALGRAPILRAVNLSIAVAALVVIGLVVWGSRDSFLAKSAAPENATAIASIVHPVIAVMPFMNSSSEPDSDYFTVGLTSEVIRNLNEGGLEVKSQTSSFELKNRPRDLRSIGELLNVTHIVEADVFRVGNRLRINAQLVQIAGEVTLWSHKFDETLEDVFAIQDEISRAIGNKLRVTLARDQRRYQTNVQAYLLYLRARAVSAGHSAERGEEAAVTAVKLFKQVIDIDRNFAPAYAGLAGVYTAMAWNVGVPATWRELRPAALKALELDPDLAETQVAMGLVYTQDRDWDSAVKSFERALALNPNLTQIHSAYSDTLVLMGQPENGLRLLEQAEKMDPLSLAVRRDLGYVQFLNGHFEDAIGNFRRVTAADPDFMSDMLESRALMMAGRPEDAIALWGSRPDDNRTWKRWLARAYAMTGRPEEFERLVAADRRVASDRTPYHLAIIYAGRGDKNRTLEALDRAADLEPPRTAAILLTPEMKFLVGEPRYDALKKKLRLP